LVTSAKEWPVVLFVGPEAHESRLKELEDQGVEIVKTNDRSLLPLLDELGKRGLQSLLVEGGAGIAGEFIDAGLVNKATFFIAPKIVGGLEAPTAVKGIGVELMRDARTLRDVMISQRGDDIEVTGYLSPKE
jgi:diaminohydroxyphosphoribosylaminopyrimidine deaminase/5-amino-6-(5-phosphoribosylamino)uracil reductase